MNFLEPALLGIVQGIAEWLPVSSEGISSIIMMSLFGKTLSEAVFLSIWLHTGTLLAAIVYFRRDLVGIVKNLTKYRPGKNRGYNGLTTFLVVSTALTGIIGAPLLFFGLEKINSLDFAMALIGFFLIVTGILQKIRGGGTRKLDARDSVLAGVVQAFSVLPGLSRSGLTTSALLFMKYDAREALRLSFLMSVPAVLAAEIGLGLLGKVSLDLYGLVAIFFSFVFGLATIKVLMKFAEKINFGWFCIFLGLASMLAVIF